MTQLQALGLTLVFEAVVAAAIARWARRPAWQVALTFVAGSLCTHPLAWTVNAALMPTFSFAPRAALIEVAVSLVEGALLAFALRMPVGRSMTMAAVVNAASFGLGLLGWWLGLL
jgi:uncharacterized membrane protein YdbT with pleckstrin-like domain